MRLNNLSKPCNSQRLLMTSLIRTKPGLYSFNNSMEKTETTTSIPS